ncbi:alpha/beta fold hydrolase [Actinomadura parmotrematis]|uniref:Alpha/beta fold hydrolase n=1 Tax=Actinomadura parmotrematis TaxID=2864039 RepID=A0ABS7FR72_9ACTN|nr:alpha/beta fold hydrolase [Actinomadura parmotrematis]MBW8482229.1 alpha/beta fold hydrolase [Actinomadura parmotrematis]
MDRTERGRHEYRALIGIDAATGLAAVRARSPQLHDTMIESVFAGPMAHAELGRADRELATVAMLAALGGAEPQLATHTRAALAQGVAASELVALAEHVASYAGFPRALNALAVIDEVTGGQPFAERRIRLRDHETRAVQHGEDGPAVVLLHALGLDWRMWEPVMRLLPGRRVIAYDLRGHGHAQGSPTPFTMDDAAADLIGVLDAFGLDRAHVVGLSYGGGIAQVAAAAHPERFASLALLATTDHPFASFEDRARSGEADGMAAQVVPSLTRWFTPAALAENAWPVRYARERVLRGTPADWAGAWRAFAGVDVQDRLADFPAPVLVLAGELDASTTPEIMKGLAARVPGSTYRELPGAPHMMSLEQPALVAAALDKFLPAAPTP